MKTERRHELQTNELAIWLNKWIEQIKPYSKGILGALIVVVVAFVAVYLVNERNEKSRSLAWTAYFNAFESGDSEAFQQVGTSYPGTGAALWALQSAGDAALAAGAGQLFRDRDAANEELESARDAYQQVVKQVDETDLSAEARQMLKQRALFGLGQALESLGDFTDAEAQYQAILDEFPDAVAAGLAKDRLDALKQQSTRDWYAWLAQQKPAESPITTPGLFDNLPELPDNPDLNLPNPGELMTPDTDSTSSGGGLLDGLPTDTTSGDESGPLLFGPENASSDEGTPKLFELPADTTDDAATDGTTVDETATSDETIDELPVLDEDSGESTTDDVDDSSSDESTDDKATDASDGS